jgi:hypothetical protein
VTPGHEGGRCKQQNFCHALTQNVKLRKQCLAHMGEGTCLQVLQNSAGLRMASPHLASLHMSQVLTTGHASVSSQSAYPTWDSYWFGSSLLMGELHFGR